LTLDLGRVTEFIDIKEILQGKQSLLQNQMKDENGEKKAFEFGVIH
ncbi:23668_t:CDS:1, partial [Entrophospora sp. SA101]